MRRYILLALFVGFAATALAQPSGSVRVTVLLEGDRTPLPGMEVRLSGGNLQHPRTVVTNVQGVAFFMAVPSGDRYELDVRGEAFPPLQGPIGRVYGNLRRDIVTYQKIDFMSCASLHWVERSLPAPGTFVWPPFEKPSPGLCI